MAKLRFVLIFDIFWTFYFIAICGGGMYYCYSYGVLFCCVGFAMFIERNLCDVDPH